MLKFRKLVYTHVLLYSSLLHSALLLLRSCPCTYSAPALALHLLFSSFTFALFALHLLSSYSALAVAFHLLLLFSCYCSSLALLLLLLFASTKKCSYTYFVHQFKFELFAPFENIFVLFAVD